MIKNSKISVTIITGFLGAGKTTFINFLLKTNPDKQFALVENEFGEVSIDTRLIKGVDASRMFELKQGCICCTISDEYELVLQELAERFPNVEQLVIETTGIADPAPVIRPFFRDNNLQKMYNFTGTVCLVDALNFKNQPEKEISIKQIAMADLVLLSKAEKLTGSEKNKLETEISRINPFCKIQVAPFGNSGQFELDTVFYHPGFYSEFSIKPGIHDEITAKTLTFLTPLIRDNFESRLSYMLDIYKNEIYRVKGILCFENEPFEFVLQGVGGSFEISEGENLVSCEKSEIVFIGKLKNLPIDFQE